MKMIVGVVALVVIIAALALAAFNSVNTPERALERYSKAAGDRDYDKMYLLISGDSKKSIIRDDFIARNKNIYEGIEARDLKLEVMSVEKIDSKQQQAYYNLGMETVAGLLGITSGDIKDALSASWVTDDIYVLVKTLPAVSAELEAALFGEGISGGNRLVVTMVEDVKERGGSGYLLPKIKTVFE